MCPDHEFDPGQMPANVRFVPLTDISARLRLTPWNFDFARRVEVQEQDDRYRIFAAHADLGNKGPHNRLTIGAVAAAAFVASKIRTW
jgi:hypothetical protein